MQIKKQMADFFRVDKELIIIFLLVAIAGFVFFFVSNQRAFLNFFYFPVLIGAYYFGKRYATHAALLSILLIFIIAYFYPATFVSSSDNQLFRWLDIVTWGGFLLTMGYCMGLLYEKKEKAGREIKSTYQGIIEMLSLLIDSVDKHTQSHSYRVSRVAERIAREMRCPEGEVENIRIAALLHDLGKLGISAEILNKIGTLSVDERETMKNHTRFGADVLAPVGGRVLQILPYVLLHHEKYDGSGYHSIAGEGIPLGARIIAVADYYDALLSDRPYRQGLSPLNARKDIIANAGTHFDPAVIKAFDAVFDKLDTDMPLMPDSLFSH
ncbi:MAG TPA: HD-GYP domain-containing protein [Thermodesulfovibrionales bacterium]|nr:HD-GYP domain-containing protein [Thermodesulfovibrionales bacterium]